MFAPSRKLTDEQVDYILQFKHVFEKAESLTGVPWRLLAAIWTRESFSVASPKRPGGPMQFDPPLTGLQITNLMTAYGNKELHANDIIAYSKKGVNDFETAVVCAACFLLQKMKGGPIKTGTDIMLAAWKYNGVVGKDPTFSPYVYNGYDEAHKTMHIVGTVPDTQHSGKRIKVNVEDHRPGVFTVYTQLENLQTLHT